MAKGKSSKKKTSAVSVDFTNTESSGLVDEADYEFEIVEASKETSDNSGEDYLKFVLEIAEGDFKGRKLFHNCSLQPQALFNLRAFLESLGQEVPQGSMDIDLDDLIGEHGACSVAHEKYQGKTKARPVEFFPVEDLEKRGEEEPEPKKKDKKEKPEKPAKGGGKKAEEPDEPTLKDVKAAAKKVDDADELKKILKKFKAKKVDDLDEDKYADFIEACEEAAGEEGGDFEVGDKVTFEDDEGDPQTGEITEIDGDDITVKVGKGKKAQEFTVEPGDLTKAD